MLSPYLTGVVLPIIRIYVALKNLLTSESMEILAWLLNDSPQMTSIPTPSIIDSGLVLHKIQAHLNYCLSCYFDIPFQNPLYFHSYLRVTSLDILFLMFIVNCLSSVIPDRLAEKLKISLHQKSPVIYIPSVRGPSSPYIGL